MKIKKLSYSSFCKFLLKHGRKKWHEKYYAMYSTVFNGIVTNPSLMLIPVDDHMVHRGDGIFETFKCVNGAIYNLKAHLDRLENSAKLLGFKWEWKRKYLLDITIQTIRAGKHHNCLIKLLISRGPGSFGVNPYDCPEQQIYLVVTELKKPFMELHPEGARMKTASISAKPAFFAGVKSCNYMQNVLMAKEASDYGVDFVAAYDENGNLTEGATENIGIISPEKYLLFPSLDRVLCGTTMLRVAKLANRLVRKGILKKIIFRNISKEEVLHASEILIVGTTPNVTFVREYDGKTIGNGKPGCVFKELSELLLNDMLYNKKLRTQVF